MRFQQTHLGVPVAFRGAGVVQNPDGTTAWAVVRVEEDLPSATPAVGRAQAAASASASVGLTAKPDDARLAYLPTAIGTKLAWIVYPSERIPGLPVAPVVAIDAQTGITIGGWNAAVSAGAAKVYATNPVASPGTMDVTLPLASGATTLDNELVQSKNCIDTKLVKPVSIFGFSLNVHVCELQQKAVADTNGDFLFPPGGDTEPEDPFSEVSMFWHVNRAYEFFHGFGMTDLSTKPLPTISNLMLPDGYQTQDLTKMSNPDLPFAPFQNAFFSPADPLFAGVFGIQGAAMWFGQGPKRDYSYDGDVIYHEFTHAVVDHTLKLIGAWHADEQGLIDSPGAMNEGLADYFSSALTGDPLVGEYAAQDLAPGLPAIRDLSNALTCPANVSGEVHSDSQFWSAGLWTARSALDATKQAAFDQAVFNVMAASPGGDLGFEDLAELFVTSVKTEVDTATGNALQAELEKRGTLPGCQRVLEFGDKPITGTDPFLANSLFTAGLGESLLGSAAYAPGPLQVHLAVAGATELKITFQVVPSGQSGGLPFNQGSPFTPKLLIHWGSEPLVFDYNANVTSNADLTLDAPIDANKVSIVTDIPPGTTSAYVMVVNAGDQGGGYRNLDFEFSGDAPDAGDDAGTDTDAGADAGTPPKTSKSDGDDGGCGCRTAETPNTSSFLLGLFAMAFASLLRRRRPR